MHQVPAVCGGGEKDRSLAETASTCCVREEKDRSVAETASRQLGWVCVEGREVQGVSESLLS